MKETAAQLDLPATWLNRDCATYAWCMPLGWEGRCVLVERFGPLETLRASRLDLIAAKVVSAPSRPQEIEDLHDLQPTAIEIEFVFKHLDRLERESLDGATFDEQRDILRSLGGKP